LLPGSGPRGPSQKRRRSLCASIIGAGMAT
jgi:hypothetical protein